MWIKKYQTPAGELQYQPADNTKVAWNPQKQGTIVIRDSDLNSDRSNTDISDGILGYVPYVGDTLQAGQSIIDFNNGNWKRGLLGASLVLVPNFIEKPIKAISKTIKAVLKRPGKEAIKEAAERGAKAADDFIKSKPVQESLKRNENKQLELIFDNPSIDDAVKINIPLSPEDYIKATEYPPTIDIKKLSREENGFSTVNISDNGRILNPSYNVDGTQWKINISSRLNPKQSESTAFHERLHMLGYGDPGSNEINSEIAESILIPKDKLKPKQLEFREYFQDPAEVAAWTAQTGRELGLKPGQEYIGLEQFKKLLKTNNERIKILKKYIKLDTPEDYENYWKALTGTLFGSAALAFPVPYTSSQSKESTIRDSK